MADATRGHPALAARDLPVLADGRLVRHRLRRVALAHPGLERFASLGVDDVALLWVRNAAIMLVVIGGQHYFLYMRKTQGTDFKYESRWPATNRKSFTFDDQVKDNMFWCLASGATVAALYEAVLFRLYAGGSLPELDVWWTVALMAAASRSSRACTSTPTIACCTSIRSTSGSTPSTTAT